MRYGFDRFLSARAAYAPTFDAGGDRLYFLSDLSGAQQLWSLPLGVPAAWPEPLTAGLDRVTAAYPSPRPGRLVVAADVGGDERTQFHLLDRPGAQPRLLTDAPRTIHTFGGWHPDGRTMAFSANDRDPRFFDVSLLDVESGERRVLYRHDGTFYAGPFSPDGRWTIVQQVFTPFDHALLLLDVATGAVRTLTERGGPTRYARPCWSRDGRAVLCVSDRGRDFLAIVALDVETGRSRPVVEAGWDVNDFALAPDGRRLACEVNADGFSEAWVHDLTDGSAVRLDIPPGQAYDSQKWTPTFAWTPDASRVALTVSVATRPAGVLLADPQSGAVERVTRTWMAGLESEDLAPATLVHYPTFDGRAIPAFVYRPHGCSGTPRPTLFYVHGGPESQIRPGYNAVIQYLVQCGFAVVAPNVRGSSGYGNAYVHLDDVERRMDSVADLAAGARWAVEAGLADSARIGVMGGSYGGFMVLAALTTYPELWAAGVDIVGIANFVTFLENTGPWRRHLRESEYGSLERDRALLEAISPIHRVERIKAPLLVIHGANDPRVPISEAEQIVESLRQRAHPVEYLRYEDEGHGVVKLRNRLDAYPRIADFLERHLTAADISGESMVGAVNVRSGVAVG
ncbi:MAG: S9 family peptidase [Chloroflexi bacterium]|nr:S9 family peptidase [Chloroflexota bacterium]